MAFVGLLLHHPVLQETSMANRLSLATMHSLETPYHCRGNHIIVFSALRSTLSGDNPTLGHVD